MSATDHLCSALVDEIATVERAVADEPLTTPAEGGRDLNPRLVDLLVREYDAVHHLARLTGPKAA